MWWILSVSVLCFIHLTQCTEELSSQDYLLPSDVIPTHYELRLLYDIDPQTKFPFFGVVDIDLTARKATSKVVLHADNITIVEEKVKLSEDEPIPITSVKLNNTYNLLTITLEKNLDVGQNYTLTIPFYGNLSNGLSGAYISNYIEQTTKNKEYLVTTQFEATYARKAFPCFDEPSFKATFNINIGHNLEYTAVSNMPLMKSTNENTLDTFWQWSVISDKFNNKPLSSFVFDQFEMSVPMSTYLVAYVVSKFSYLESPKELSTTKFRIWARKDAINQTKYASQVGPRVLTYFEKWFNVPFPLPKQDMIAIPDFSAGAMENWGLITYRETALLYDEKESSFASKERVAEVISHELAHQWFGNLVTMKWWSDLWLNEGFATFMASIGVAAVEPTWHAVETNAVDDILVLLSADALESSHPVSVPIDDPTLISEIFDEISYRKGSTLIRMMTMFLGEEVVRKALNKYLLKYSYKNAEQDDLWAELTEASWKYGAGRLPRNLTVKEVMDTWTTQTGYPLITARRDYTDNTAYVTQHRYLASGLKPATTTSWWVPLNVLCEKDADLSQSQTLEWLSVDEGTVQEHKFEYCSGADEWLLFNKDYIAPYRVNYDLKNWQLLIKALNSDKYTKIPMLSRVQLLGDAFGLAWTNAIDYSLPLELANYLQREKEYLPLNTGLRQLGKIENVLRRSPDYGAFQKFVRKLISETYRSAGGLATKKIINGNDLLSVKMQTMLSSWACRMNVPGCEDNAIELFQQWMDTEDPDANNPIPLELRSTVYCTAVKRGTVVHWRFVLARMKNTNVASARTVLQSALGCTREIWILAQYLEWTLDPSSDIRTQDVTSAMRSMLGSTVGYYLAKDFVYDRIADIHERFKDHASTIGRIVKYLLEQFTSQRELDEFMEWRVKNEQYLNESKLAVKQAVESVRVNLEWSQKNKKRVVEKLREFSASSS